LSRTEWSSSWRSRYGPHWRAWLTLFILLLVARGFIETLSDADLPMHLAIGEWIVRHGTVPFVEPFAWTRAGAPFYAYSWAMDVVLYGVADVSGKIGLRLLNGLLVAAAFAAMIVLGRAARWDPRTALLMGVMNIVIMSVIVNSVRPQALLFTLIPLAWALTYWTLDSERPGRALLGIAAVSAVAANTHIFFPLTAIPWLLFIDRTPAERWRVYAVIAVTVAGWLLSPYTLVLGDVFALSTQPNPVLKPPSSITEAQPGFVIMRQNWILLPIAVFLSALPWMVRREDHSGRRRLAWGIAWVLGMIAFASGVRLLLVWWMLILPLVAEAFQRMASYLLATEQQSVRLWRITAVWFVCSLLFLSLKPFDEEAWRFENPAGTSRRLARMEWTGLEQIAQWLECNARPDARGRVFTDFNFGSALTWRLPRYSMSVDGRTIFPDSVAKAEAFYDPFRERLRLGPWRSADLAIMPVPSAIGDVLDRAPEWRKAAIAHTAETSTALWVTQAWWSRAGKNTFTRSESLLPGRPSPDSGCSRNMPASNR